VVAATREELRTALAGSRSGGRTRAIVPTMGALHAGHLDLIDQARLCADEVVVSIFVNPLQFGPGEDFTRYPRDIDRDIGRCAGAGVNVVFTPSVAEMYPSGAPVVTIDPGPLGRLLEGEARPGHFTGVLTVVAKLLNLVQPDLAAFGEKDYQQLVLVRRLVTDLFLPIHVLGVQTRREPDGLALSSRNRYLKPSERAAALNLSRALRAGADTAASGADAVLSAAWGVLVQEPQLDVEYVELRTPDLAAAATGGEARLLVAARVGATRLIDNARVDLP
jgi:pantoate--beta-alanine ligase